MINKFLKYGATVGLLLSFLGFIIFKSNLFSDSFSVVYENIYTFSKIISVLFMLTVSKFINEKFNLIFKTLGFIFLAIFGIKFLNELNFYKIGDIQMLILTLFSIPVIMYMNFFRRKTKKIFLDYLKITFIIAVFLGGFFKINGLHDLYLVRVNQILFWSIVIGSLLEEYSKENMKVLN